MPAAIDQHLTKEIILSKFTYDEENGLFCFRKGQGVTEGKEAGWTSNGYRRCWITIGGVKQHFAVHRMVWIIHHDLIPIGAIIDHIDRDKLNNKIGNLRICTLQQNSGNRKDQHDMMGVTRADTIAEKWIARIGSGPSSKYLGIFDSKEAASKAYKNAAKERYKEFFNG